MADGRLNTCSELNKNISILNEPNPTRTEKLWPLVLKEHDLLWEGDLNSLGLKEFIEHGLLMSGRWSAQRGEKAQFSNPEFCLKWNGETDKRITITQDNDQSQLYGTIKSYATCWRAANQEKSKNKTRQFAEVEESKGETEANTSSITNGSCNQCHKNEEKLSELLNLISEIQRKQNEP